MVHRYDVRNILGYLLVWHFCTVAATHFAYCGFLLYVCIYGFDSSSLSSDIGMVTVGATYKDAKIAADIYEHTISTCKVCYVFYG